MITWIVSNIGTIVVALIVAGVLTAIVISVVRDKKAGKAFRDTLLLCILA